ncbi:Hypothetical protein RG1141_CH24260 [Neorhizobium galegae bv. officinalis bv. officinalis str. HAMBI 1141]|uniref:DUF4376 domain-containing protein n=1 Tax=Neorhizobium galegae bv. officinalis bv. officinalis str. HAMBI 1141 TaxID=1028801 RepID=A0A068T9F5_NEOGA|nr:DUF4376 domain-containing protein [Neorhizobium galegae]CDN54764.1 Hypothetical protein RG1141_CH24260 [Neorhizobium galegae bv. officinalis bv. officinalis str. HAMBI 1141]
MSEKFYVTFDGEWIGAFEGPAPGNAIAVPVAPLSASQRWSFDQARFLDPSPASADVDAERDRRITAGFVFDGVLYQSDKEARENIMGAHKAASDAMMLFGAQAGNFAWRKLLDPAGPEVFEWIASDNSRVPMDAQTVLRFGYAALAHKASHIFATSDLKSMDPIPADFATNPVYWPAAT